MYRRGMTSYTSAAWRLKRETMSIIVAIGRLHLV